ncbi:MAG TPA: DMT family transporter [Bacillota bacterium]
MTVKGIVYAILAAFCFGIMPIFTKLLYSSTGVDPFFFLMLRYSFAAILMWLFIWIRRDTSWRGLDRSSLGMITVCGVSYTIVTSTYFVALQYIDASLNSLLTFTFPIFTPFLALLFFKQKLKLLPVIAALVGFAGCGLLIGGYRLRGAPHELMGIGLGLVSGVIYAVYTLMGQKMTVNLKPFTITTLNLSIVACFFVTLRFGWLWRYHAPLRVYLVALLIAVVSTILANIFYFESIRNVGAIKAGIFSSFEPFFTAILATGFLGEHLSSVQWLGAAFIIGGMIIVQRPWETRRR